MKLIRFWKMFNQQAEKCGFADIISDKEETIMHCRKSLLFNNSEIWIKKEGSKDFDVIMDSFDGAEICHLVDVYILYILRINMEEVIMVYIGMMG